MNIYIYIYVYIYIYIYIYSFREVECFDEHFAYIAGGEASASQCNAKRYTHLFLMPMYERTIEQ
jgi:hypothetical protein